MSLQTDPLPPVPQHTPPIDKSAGAQERFERTWMQWFVQVRDKVNIINASLVSLATLISTGFLSKQTDGSWATRTIEGTEGEIVVVNGDGVGGNPVISIDPSFQGGTALNIAFDGGSIAETYDDLIDDDLDQFSTADIYDAGNL